MVSFVFGMFHRGTRRIFGVTLFALACQYIHHAQIENGVFMFIDIQSGETGRLDSCQHIKRGNMRTIIEKLIVTAFLLCTSLLAAEPSYAVPLYFPHVATYSGWQTEIAIINTSPDQSVTGTLRAFNDDGQPIEDTIPVALSAHGRRQITVANEFTNHTNIRHIIFDANSTTVQGYTKFYREGKYRVAIPAVREVNTGDIYVTHIASNDRWWTGLSLVNTTATAKTVTINFSDGQTKEVTIAANGHRTFAIRDLFNQQPQPGIESAVITNASGVIGLELFGGFPEGSQLDGILLTDKTASTLYYPDVVGGEWWTGIVAYNPSAVPCTITVKPFSAQGTALSSSTLSIPGKGKYVGSVTGLGLPAETAWFKIDSTSPLSGFELIGSNDFEQLAAYAGDGETGAKAGVFAKIEKQGWTGIAFVNTEENGASVTLTAYKDNGAVVDTTAVSVDGHAKVIRAAELIFSEDISSATSIAYSSDRNVVAFQLNGSLDWTMLDGLPALANPPQQKSGEHDEPGDYIWDSSEVITVELNGNAITVNSANATVNGSTVSITSAGTYSITGSLSDGQLIVNTNEDEIVRIVLNGVTMSNCGSAPIYVQNANKTLIVLATDTNNYVTTSSPSPDSGAGEINAVIYSTNNLTFYGDGSLTVKGNYKDGITSKQGLIIKSGNITVESVDHGIRAKDYLVVQNGTLKINAGGDGLKSDNAKDAAKGYITIQDGEFDIIAKGDAISAETNIMISAGIFLISSGGGSNNRDYLVNDTSAKGIKAGASLIIADGSFTMDSADKAIHSNGSLAINGGSFTIASGDQAIRADTTLEINGGEISITKCDEGIESRYMLTINGGNIHIVSSDNGLNVASGTKRSVSNRMPSFQDPFPYYLFINGGYIVIDTKFGDGIDANGTVEMSGGDIIINGPTRSDNGALDFLKFKMTGGFLIGTGTTGEEQKPIGRSSTQCSLMVIFDSSQQPGTVVHIQTSEGKNIVTFMPTKTYQSIVFSSPELQLGKTYNLFLGGSSTGAGTDGLYQDGEYIPGILYASFTISGVVTIVE
jgi:hypothetical protein